MNMLIDIAEKQVYHITVRVNKKLDGRVHRALLENRMENKSQWIKGLIEKELERLGI